MNKYIFISLTALLFSCYHLDYDEFTADEFLNEYNQNYSMLKGNPEMDGKEVIINGKIDKVSQSMQENGKTYTSVCFGDNPGPFGKCAINFLFPSNSSKDLITIMQANEMITISGFVETKKFGTITLKKCKLN